MYPVPPDWLCAGSVTGYPSPEVIKRIEKHLSVKHNVEPNSPTQTFLNVECQKGSYDMTKLQLSHQTVYVAIYSYKESEHCIDKSVLCVGALLFDEVWSLNIDLNFHCH